MDVIQVHLLSNTLKDVILHNNRIYYVIQPKNGKVNIYVYDPTRNKHEFIMKKNMSIYIADIVELFIFVGFNGSVLEFESQDEETSIGLVSFNGNVEVKGSIIGRDSTTYNM